MKRALIYALFHSSKQNVHIHVQSCTLCMCIFACGVRSVVLVLHKLNVSLCTQSVLSHTYTYSHTHTLSLTHTYTHTLTRSHTLTLSLSLSLSLTPHTLTHSHSLSPSHTQAKSVEEVLSDKQGLERERVWVVHRGGFSLGTVQPEAAVSSTFSTHFSIVRYQVRGPPSSETFNRQIATHAQHNTSHHVTTHHITTHHITTHHNTTHHNTTSPHNTSHHNTSHHITSQHITSHHNTT